MINAQDTFTDSLPNTDLIAKYNQHCPRYTSYPTANVMKPLEPWVYSAALLSVKEKPFEPLSLYLHIPFCADICYFCGCNKVVTKNRKEADTYLDYLAKEMAMLENLIKKRRTVNQLHLGGGTPTFLNDGQLTRLMTLLAQHFKLSKDETREFSIEVDPRTVNASTLALLKGLGFNRISFGVQDFDPKVQKAMNREHRLEDIEQLVAQARLLGFTSINLDLLYGLPLQSVTSFARTLAALIKIKPDRIALYHYAHLPERFKSQRALDRLGVPDSQLKLTLYQQAIDNLTEAGYRMIGMDHFVLENDELYSALQHKKLQRNFQGYSVKKACDLIGLGVSAISQTESMLFQNAKSLDDYYQALDASTFAYDKGCLSNEADTQTRSVIMQLMTTFQVNIQSFESTYGVSFKQTFATALSALTPYIKDGLVEINKTWLQLTPKGYYFVRQIAAQFDSYHNNNSTEFSKAI